jgi:isochorismate hydrolase
MRLAFFWAGAEMPAVSATPYEFNLPPDRTALVIIDMQRDFLEPGGFGAALAMTSIISVARSRRLPMSWPPAAPPACW